MSLNTPYQLVTDFNDANRNSLSSPTPFPVTVVAGQSVFLHLAYRKIAGNFFTIPTINGQSFTRVEPTVDAGTFYLDSFSIVANTTGTFNIQATNPQFVYLNAFLMVVESTVPLATIEFLPPVTKIYHSGGFTSAQVTVNGVNSSDLIYNLFSACVSDSGFSPVTTTWTADAPATLVNSVLNSNLQNGYLYVSKSVNQSGSILNGFTRSNSQQPRYALQSMIIREIGGVITSVNGGADTAYIGTPTPIVVAGFSPNSGTLGAKVLVTVSSTFFTSPNFVDGQFYFNPLVDQPLVLTDSVASITVTRNNITPILPTDMAAVVVQDADIVDTEKLGYWMTADGRNLQDGCLLIYFEADVTFEPDTGGYAPTPVQTLVWLWELSSSKMYSYNVTIKDATIIGAVRFIEPIEFIGWME